MPSMSGRDRRPRCFRYAPSGQYQHLFQGLQDEDLPVSIKWLRPQAVFDKPHEVEGEKAIKRTVVKAVGIIT